MSQARNIAIHISSKYKIQMEPIQFEWDKFLPTLEKDFPEILNEVLWHSNNQHQQPNSNKNRNTSSKNKNQYNTVINNRIRTLTALSPLATHTNRAHGFQHMLHSMPENNTYGGNGYLTNHRYQETQNGRHNFYTAPFR